MGESRAHRRLFRRPALGRRCGRKRTLRPRLSETKQFAGAGPVPERGWHFRLYVFVARKGAWSFPTEGAHVTAPQPRTAPSTAGPTAEGSPPQGAHGPGPEASGAGSRRAHDADRLLAGPPGEAGHLGQPALSRGSPGGRGPHFCQDGGGNQRAGTADLVRTFVKLALGFECFVLHTSR